MKYHEVIKMIEKDGWYLDRTKGSHRQYEHPTKKGTVTIAYHRSSQDVPPGMLQSILKQAHITKGKKA